MKKTKHTPSSWANFSRKYQLLLLIDCSSNDQRMGLVFIAEEQKRLFSRELKQKNSEQEFRRKIIARFD